MLLLLFGRMIWLCFGCVFVFVFVCGEGEESVFAVEVGCGSSQESLESHQGVVTFSNA